VLLAEYAAFFNKPEMINTRADDIAKVTAADVQRVASRYLVKSGRTVVVSMPKAPAPGGQR
jgi:predicted Zn-dependent peptidase